MGRGSPAGLWQGKGRKKAKGGAQVNFIVSFFLLASGPGLGRLFWGEFPDFKAWGKIIDRRE